MKLRNSLAIVIAVAAAQATAAAAATSSEEDTSSNGFRFCPEGESNQVGLIWGETSQTGRQYCWKIEDGKRGIRHGAKIVLDECKYPNGGRNMEDFDQSQLFIHCSPNHRDFVDGAQEKKISPYLAPEYIVSVREEADGMPLRLELRQNPPRNEEHFYRLDILSSFSHVGIGGTDMDCTSNPAHNWDHLDDDPKDGNIYKVNEECLFAMTQDDKAQKGTRVVARTADVIKKRENNRDYNVITRWFFNDMGFWPPEEVEPPGDKKGGCSRVSPSGSMCKVIMKDSMNKDESLLQVKALGGGSFVVTDGPDTDDPWNVRVEAPTSDCKDCPLTVKAGVPDVSCSEVKTDYRMVDNEQLTFLDVISFPCTNFGKSIIYFLIMEWYYFG